MVRVRARRCSRRLSQHIIHGPEVEPKPRPTQQLNQLASLQESIAILIADGEEEPKVVLQLVWSVLGRIELGGHLGHRFGRVLLSNILKKGALK